MRASIRSHRGRARVACAAVFVLALSVMGSAAASDSGAWTIKSGTVRIVCPLTVGGSFEAKTSAVSGGFGPGAVPVAITVDLATLDSGIALRNEHLRRDYLETERGERYSQAVLSEIAVTGVDAAGSGRGSFTGMLSLHGQLRPVRGKATLKRDGASLQVQAEFPVALPQFDVPTPRYMGVGVRDEVVVHVRIEAAQP